MRRALAEITFAVLLVSCSTPSGSKQARGATGSEPELLAFRVTRQLQLPTSDRQQGVATDGESLYLQTTHQLFKYDLQGNQVQVGPKSSLHHGGIVWVNGRIYAAVSGCKRKGTDQHFVHVYDAQSLALLETHDIGAHFSICAGGIAHREGRFFVAESFFDNDHGDRIVEFDGNFRRVRQHLVGFKSPYGIQGIEYLPEVDQFQIHSHGRDFYRIDANFEGGTLRRGRAEFDLQDIARLDASTLVVNHRKARKLVFVDLEM